ncbi:MAG: Ger(x)C family spore germination protein, partial [Alicyclobacillus sp.]|nr:Ger(x)C family spore germination protein [Alicyclobacillus sp.]
MAKFTKSRRVNALERTLLSRRALLAMSVGCSLFLGGCFDRQELEEQAFVTSLAIDQAPGGLIDCTMRIALPKNQATGAGGGGGGGGGGGQTPMAGTAPFTFRARTVTEAFRIANSSIERTLTLSHLSNLIFGEDLARAGLATQMDSLIRFREFRRTVYVKVSRGPARDILMQDKPVLEPSTDRMGDAVANVSRRSGLIPSSSHLHDLVLALENPHEAPVLPLIAVNPRVQEDPKGEQPPGTTAVSYQAGRVTRAGGNPVEWSGAGVFRGDRLVGFLNGDEVTQLRLLNGTLPATKMEFRDPVRPANLVGLWIREEHDPHYTVRLGNPLRIQVHIPLDADLIDVESGVDYTRPALRRKLEHSVAEQVANDARQLMLKLFHQYQADCIPVSRHARRLFATHNAFVRYPWEQRLKQAEVVVTSEVHLRRFGVQRTPFPATGRRGGPRVRCRPARPRSWLSIRRLSWRSVPMMCRP